MKNYFLKCSIILLIHQALGAAVWDDEDLYFVDDIVDEPKCGFDGIKCLEGDKKVYFVYLLAFLLLMFLLIMPLYYKIWVAEQKITGLQWRISKDEIEPIEPMTRLEGSMVRQFFKCIVGTYYKLRK